MRDFGRDLVDVADGFGREDAVQDAVENAVELDNVSDLGGPFVWSFVPSNISVIGTLEDREYSKPAGAVIKGRG